MTQNLHALIRMYFAAMPSGLAADMFTEDFTAWTTTAGGGTNRDRYLGGVRLLQSLFPAGLHYTVDSVTAEEDRVAAEVRSRGVLANGEEFQNSYMFLFRVADGKIAAIAEHFNPAPVQEKLMPLLQAAMAKAGAKPGS